MIVAIVERATSARVASFAKEIGAVIAMPRSSGQTEGQACRLKRAKRQIYGQGTSVFSRPG